MFNYKSIIAEMICKKAEINAEQVAKMITRPPDSKMGDYAFPCFPLAKTMRKAPNAIAAELSGTIELVAPFSHAAAAGPYINFTVDKAAIVGDTIQSVLKGEGPFSKQAPSGNPVVVEYSSPNVAKPFSIGHLRSTVIGAAISRINEYVGTPVIRINHIGDWGTQFGKLIYAYRTWGSPDILKEDATSALYELYVKYHEESEKDESLDQKAREIFADLEKGDEEITNLWKLFVESTLNDIKKVYKSLNVEFDHYTGESFYNDKMEKAVSKIEDAGLLVESKGAMVVDLEKYKMPPCLLKKTDGSSLYATRDLAALLYRVENYDPKGIIYVVGNEQKLHFKQLFKVLELAGMDVSKVAEHVGFGLYRFGNEKMSTRRGKVIFMADVLESANELALKLINEKNPDLANPEEVSRMVGTGAVIFGDLVNDRSRDIDFSWEKILSFEGDTGPYIQYSRARINSIVRKARTEGDIDPDTLENMDFTELASELEVHDHELELAKEILKFETSLEKAVKESKPHHIAKTGLEIARAFNRFYHACPVLKGEKDVRTYRLGLAVAAGNTIETILNLLGVDAPEEM
jgi:arginyl-tRNA synthetase